MALLMFMVFPNPNKAAAQVSAGATSLFESSRIRRLLADSLNQRSIVMNLRIIEKVILPIHHRRISIYVPEDMWLDMLCKTIA